MESPQDPIHVISRSWLFLSYMLVILLTLWAQPLSPM